LRSKQGEGFNLMPKAGEPPVMTGMFDARRAPTNPRCNSELSPPLLVYVLRGLGGEAIFRGFLIGKSLGYAKEGAKVFTFAFLFAHQPCNMFRHVVRICDQFVDTSQELVYN